MGWLMNKKLESVWKEAVMLFRICFGGGEEGGRGRKIFRIDGLRVQIWTYISLTGDRIPNQPNATVSLHIHSFTADKHIRRTQNSFLFQKREISLTSLLYRLSVILGELITKSPLLTFWMLNPVTLRYKMRLGSYNVYVHSHIQFIRPVS